MSTIEETTPQRGGSRAGKMPKYEVGEAVAELPAEPPRVKARVYFNLLEQVKADEDKAGLWVPIATFTTPTGARDVQRSFTKGERDCPKGEWEFKAVKLVDPENASKRISKLFVRYMGEG